jgi:purine-binding chemotaxis protein CheW
MYIVENLEKQLVVFKLDTYYFGIDIIKISEMIEIDAMRAADDTFSFALGTLEVRGNSVPVVDLRKRFHLAKALKNKDNRILVVDCRNQELGIIVDSVTELIKVPESGILPIDYLFIGEHLEHLTGVVKLKDKPVLLMDLDSLLTEAEHDTIKYRKKEYIKILC